MKRYTSEEERLVYGEPIAEEDNDLCEIHGCRLRYNMLVGWECPSCVKEDATIDHEEYNKMMEQELNDREPCVIIHNQNFTAFCCKMPWWA